MILIILFFFFPSKTKGFSHYTTKCRYVYGLGKYKGVKTFGPFYIYTYLLILFHVNSMCKKQCSQIVFTNIFNSKTHDIFIIEQPRFNEQTLNVC